MTEKVEREDDWGEKEWSRVFRHLLSPVLLIFLLIFSQLSRPLSFVRVLFNPTAMEQTCG